eukprot:1234514-Prymnesium_polylepis.1
MRENYKESASAQFKRTEQLLIQKGQVRLLVMAEDTPQAVSHEQRCVHAAAAQALLDPPLHAGLQAASE